MNRQTTVTLLVVLVAFCVSMTTAQDQPQLTEEQKALVNEFARTVMKMLDEMHGALIRDASPELKKGIEDLMRNADHMTPEQIMQEIQKFEHLLTPEQLKRVESIGNKYKPKVEKLVEQIKSFSSGGDKGKGAETLTTFGSIAIVAALTVF